MTLSSHDRKTLLWRLVLLALVVRLVPMMGSDPGPSEAATALGLGGDGPSGEWLARLTHGWVVAIGGGSLLARLPVLAMDLLLPVLALRYATAAGWGALPGLLAGLVLAVTPLGVESGYRLDLGSGWAVAALFALGLQRQGLLASRLAPVLAGAGVLLLVGACAPPVLVVAPAGVYLALRAWADRPVKGAAIAGWLVAPLMALAIRWFTFGFLVPEADAAARWLVMPGWAAEPSGWREVGLLGAAWQALVALLPGGPVGELAAQMGTVPAPVWTVAASMALLAVAVFGLWRGRVQAEPAVPAEPTSWSRLLWLAAVAGVAVAVPLVRAGHRAGLALALVVAAGVVAWLLMRVLRKQRSPVPLQPPRAEPLATTGASHEDEAQADAAEDDDGAGAADQWRTLGVALPSAPRELGDRDWLPPLACVLGAVVYAAQAGARGVPDGVGTALAVGRVGTALLLGLGLGALVVSRDRSSETSQRTRLPWLMAAAALALVGLGAAHLLRQVGSLDRIGPRKIAQYIDQHGGSEASVLALGPRGLPLAFSLDPTGQSPRVRVSPLEPAHAIHALITLLPARPPSLMLTGDRALLVESPAASELAADLQATGQSLDGSLQLAGYVAQDASALGATAVVRYRPPTTPDPGSVRPQLMPGVAP